MRPLFCLLMIFTLLAPSAAQWFWAGVVSDQARADVMPPPENHFWLTSTFAGADHTPSITAVAFDQTIPGLALAAEDTVRGRLWRSTDHGVHWSLLPGFQSSDLRYSYKVAYGALPETFYAYSPARVFKTSDAGETWTELPYETSNCAYLMTLVAHPITPTILFAGANYAFARSLDGGQTWDATPPMPGYPGACSNDIYASSIAVGVNRPNVIYVGQNWNSGGVLKSTDLGESWQAVNTGLPTSNDFNDILVKQVVVDPRDADIAYALMNRSHQVYRTTNGGEQWQPLTQGAEGVSFDALAFDVAAADAGQGAGLYALDHTDVYFLPDGADAWQEVRSERPGINGGSIAGDIVVDPFVPGRIILRNSDGIAVQLPLRGRAFLPALKR